MQTSAIWFAQVVTAGAFALGGCQGSSFSGESPKAPASDDDKIDDDEVDDSDDDINTGIDTATQLGEIASGTGSGTGTGTEPAFNVVECSNPAGVADPVGTYAFTSENEIRDYVNSLARYPQIPTQFLGAGGIRTDQASADVVCQLKGYDHSTGFTSKSYSSCGDNYIVWWEEAQKTFSSHNACDGNSRLGTLNCTGKLRDECSQDLDWVFGIPPTP